MQCGLCDKTCVCYQWRCIIILHHNVISGGVSLYYITMLSVAVYHYTTSQCYQWRCIIILHHNVISGGVSLYYITMLSVVVYHYTTSQCYQWRCIIILITMELQIQREYVL